MASVSPPRKSLLPWHLSSSPQCQESHFTWDKWWAQYTPPLHLPWIPSWGLFSGSLAFSLPHSLFFYPLSSNFLLQSAHGTCPLNLAAWAALPCQVQAFSHHVMENQPVPKNNVKGEARDIVMRHSGSGMKKYTLSPIFLSLSPQPHLKSKHSSSLQEGTLGTGPRYSHKLLLPSPVTHLSTSRLIVLSLENTKCSWDTNLIPRDAGKDVSKVTPSQVWTGCSAYVENSLRHWRNQFQMKQSRVQSHVRWHINKLLSMW